jgi:MFS family permease
MAPLMAAFSAGAAMGPAIGGFLADQFGLRPPFLFVGAAIGCVAINNYLMCPETRKKKSESELEFEKNNPKSLRTEFTSTIRQWIPILQSLDNRCITLVHTCFWFTQAGCAFTLMPLYATNILEMSMSQIGIIFAMMSVVNMIGSQPFAWFADKHGRKIVILPAVLLISTTIPLIQLCDDAQKLTFLMFFYSVGSCMMGASPTAYMADMNPTEVRSQALAVLRSGGEVGLMLGSGLLGYVAYVADYGLAFNTGSIVILAAGLNFTIRARESVQTKH